MDQETLLATLLRVVERNLAKMGTIVQSDSPSAQIVDLVEYDGRMKVTGLDKFDSSSYISVINMFHNAADQQKHKNVKGAFVMYFDSENAGKMYKFLGFPPPDDEDDLSMMQSNAKVAQMIVDDFKAEMASEGYTDLFLSEAENYKNNVIHGVEYSKDQKKKIELIFKYFKHNAVAVDLTLALPPKKR